MYNFNLSELNTYSKYLFLCRDDGVFYQVMDPFEAPTLVAEGSCLEQTTRPENTGTKCILPKALLMRHSANLLFTVLNLSLHFISLPTFFS